uniref:Uncharacterized protein n=1 Tax=Myotis myotis TaxID=51298 RepID=A0A7J7WVS1_MYOMY|nr:hypothetical protein mMyoMyo1_011949 [Myotis myotis]
MLLSHWWMEDPHRLSDYGTHPRPHHAHCFGCAQGPSSCGTCCLQGTTGMRLIVKVQSPWLGGVHSGNHCREVSETHGRVVEQLCNEYHKLMNKNRPRDIEASDCQTSEGRQGRGRGDQPMNSYAYAHNS